jgi:hypothetical protein
VVYAACGAQNQSVRGVYLDQIGSNPPQLDCSPGRTHPPGGGSWWVAGYAELLSRARAASGAGVGLFTEAGEEPFLGEVVGFLARIALDEFPGAGFAGIRVVPAFQAVYAQYTTSYGRNTTVPGWATASESVRRTTFYATVGQQLVLGVQLGWSGPFPALNNHSDGFSARGVQLLGIIIEPEMFRFFKEALAVRRLVRSYLLHGELLRPLAGLSSEDVGAPCLSDGCLDLRHSVWRRRDVDGGAPGIGNSTTILVLLSSVLSRNVSLRLDLARYGLATVNAYALRQLETDGQSVVRATTTRGALSIEYNWTMRAGAIVPLEISAVSE